MIERIKKIIQGDDLKISKFFHGDPSRNTKILFFVSHLDKPFCIIKIVRSEEENDLILREIDGIKYFGSAGLKVPKIINYGQIDGLNYVAEEILVGMPAGKAAETSIFPAIAGYHKSIVKDRKIKIKTILDSLRELKINPDEEMAQTLELFSLRENREVYVAPQHGDLTYKNLIVNEGEISFIDFENFGLYSVWGMDITHYMTRMFNIYEQKRNVSETMNYFVSVSRKYRKDYDLEISDEECVDLFLLDLLFEILKKTLFVMKKDIIPVIKNIWLK